MNIRRFRSRIEEEEEVEQIRIEEEEIFSAILLIMPW